MPLIYSFFIVTGKIMVNGEAIVELLSCLQHASYYGMFNKIDLRAFLKM